MQVSWKDYITYIRGTQYSIALSLCLSYNDMVTRMKAEVQARKPNWGKMHRANDILLLYQRDTRQGCLANSYILPINLLNRTVMGFM